MVHARLPLGLYQRRVQLVIGQLPGVGELKELLLGSSSISMKLICINLELGIRFRSQKGFRRLFPRISNMDTTFLAIEDELLHRPDEARRRGGELHQFPWVDPADIHLTVTEQRLGARGIGCLMIL